MTLYFSSIDNIVEKHAGILVDESQTYDWPVKNTHKKDYFDVFEKLVNGKSFWIGNPDSFKVAACLLVSLLEEKVLSFPVNESMPTDIVLYNYRLAVNVALEYLSTTKIHTYTADKKGHFVKEQTHPTVEMAFPVGIIEAEDMYTSFCKALANEDLNSNYRSIPQIAIILHMLYCYCKRKEDK